MSNSSNSEPRVRTSADQRRLDLATLGDGGVIVIIRGNVSTDKDLKIVVNAPLSVTESMKVKDGTVFNVRATG